MRRLLASMKISEGETMSGYQFTLTYPWDTNRYKPYVEYTLDLDEVGFLMKIQVQEKDPKRTRTAHQQEVHKDSCVEWFVNFMPETCDRYFNFEVNANGKMQVAFRKDRYEKTLLTEEDIEELDIKAEVGEESWKVCYHVPFSLIRRYIPDYQFVPGMKIRTNFYKCGDETDFPHYGIWKESPLEKPDFHRPEYFGEIIIK